MPSFNSDILVTKVGRSFVAVVSFLVPSLARERPLLKFFKLADNSLEPLVNYVVPLFKSFTPVLKAGILFTISLTLLFKVAVPSAS